MSERSSRDGPGSLRGGVRPWRGLHIRSRSTLTRLLGVPLALAAIVLAPVVSASAQAPAGQGEPAAVGALRTPFQLVEDRAVSDRLAQPEDRYAPAGGCYTIEAPGGGHVARDGGAVVLVADRAAAEPFHFQAIRLGEYLIATNEGRSTEVEGAWWDERGYLAAAEVASGEETVPGEEEIPVPVTDAVTVADAPDEPGEWRLRAAGPDPEASNLDGQPYLLDLPRVGKALTVRDGALTLTDGDGSDTAFVLHHVPDDAPADGDPNGTACANWPEIRTNTSGPPTPPDTGPAGEVEGFFEAHVHGMAYEFLGGEVRCGAPWHKYGVEHALPNCNDDGQALQPATELVLAGADPATYDPVGWPTFGFWPRHDTYTHEQYYWKWLERAYHGGLRLTTNLFVDNTALCEAYPNKKNSCNEMDAVRLQARRIFELQDYVDAQSGGPGEGWFRIVTTPVQARQAINAGRMAVVLGIEVSVLFDCGEIMGQPQCTKDDIDTRLEEVRAMGVQQLEIINKFDNALSGVTGDAGATGMIVNQGNRSVTGHYWDMRTCPDSADDGHRTHDHGVLPGEQHDKTQLNPSDDTPIGGSGEVDVLAAQILNEFGGATSAAAPAYPPAPHCNQLGLTELGRHLVRRLAETGMIFDPDHMSATAQRQALDLVEDELIPDAHQTAHDTGAPRRIPGLISSHSWANDVVYQRIYDLSGTVAPRTGDAAEFADRWAQHRAWARELLPPDLVFGLGYGADTNGFGAQPGPRSEPAQPVTYDQHGFAAPIGDVTIHQQTSGVRTFDIAAEGVAHYGMFADWFHELRLAADEQYPDLGGGDAIIADMLRAPEAYLQMWERNVYGRSDCVADQSTFQVEDLHALAGGNVEGYMRAIGQPISRDGDVYTYCGADEDGETTPTDVTFDEDGDADTVEENPGTVTPQPAADGHAHARPSLPASGGGLLQVGLLLLGAGALGTRFLR